MQKPPEIAQDSSQEIKKKEQERITKILKTPRMYQKGNSRKRIRNNHQPESTLGKFIHMKVDIQELLKPKSPQPSDTPENLKHIFKDQQLIWEADWRSPKRAIRPVAAIKKQKKLTKLLGNNISSEDI